MVTKFHVAELGYEMQCNNPKILRPRGVDLILPCGKCIACRINRREEWTTRIMHETAFSESAVFVTLTYDEQSVPWIDLDGVPVRVASKDDIQSFVHKIRKTFEGLPDPPKIRYFIGSERGPTTDRPHYHGIIWNLPEGFRNEYFLSRCWHRGFVTVSEFNIRRARYVAKYYVGRENSKSLPPPMLDFSLMSRRPGIGRQFVERNKERIDYYNLGTVSLAGKTVPLPRYYRNLCYSDETKERRYKEFESSQDFEKYKAINGSLGQELEEIMTAEYRRKHCKEL